MSFWSSLSKGLKSAWKTVTNPSSAVKEFAGSSILAGLGIPSVSGMGSSLVDNWDKVGKELYGAVGGKIPFTDVNPIDRYLGRDIAEKNFKYQQEAYEYQKYLNENSAQIRLKDFQSAGINPVLASGSIGAPLKAGTAPQMADTSGALREGIGSIFSLLSMKKDFAVKDAEISKLYADRDKANAEAAGIRIDNQTRGEGNVLNLISKRLDNQFVSQSIPLKIQDMTNHLDLQELKKIHMGFENELSRIGVDIAELDRTYKELGIIDLRKKIELDTLALLHKTQEYEAYKFARGFYEGRWNVPTGFNLSSLVGAIVGVGSGFGKLIKNFFNDAFGKEPAPRNPSGFGGTGASRDFDVDPAAFVPLALDEDYTFGPSVSEVIKNFVSSYRRGADGVRRNQYSVLLK